MSSSSSPASRVASIVASDIRRTAALKVSWPCIRMTWSSWPARIEGAPLPSECRTMWPMRPRPSSEAVTRAAPAPSANSAAVPRSVLSVKRLSTSAPITSTLSARPPSTCAVASESAERKPVQAALTSMAPARTAPRSYATSGAQFGVSSSAASVATRTRSRSSGRTPASASAWRPAAAARSWRRSPSETWRRSWTPVRCRIHCSVTPAPAATASFVTTRSGTAMETDARAAARRWRSHGMGVAVTAAAGSEAAASRTAALASGKRSSGLRTGGLHRKGLPHKVRQDGARTCLHELGHPARVERADDVEPANRLGERPDQLTRDVLEGLCGHARHHRDARLGEFDALHHRSERVDRGLHQRGVERPRHRQPLAADAALPELRLGAVQRVERARQHELVGGVVVGDRHVRGGGDLRNRVAVVLTRAHGGHPAVARLLRGLLHEASARCDEPKAVLRADRTGRHERGDLAERMAGHDAGLDVELLRAGEGGAVDGRLCPAGAVRGALEHVRADLLESELDQVRPRTLDGVAHVSGLASLPRKEQRG